MPIPTRATADRIMRLLNRTGDSLTSSARPARGGMHARKPVIAICDSITPADASGVGAQCYSATLIDLNSLATSQAGGGEVWLTVLDDEGVTVPALNTPYIAVMAGEVDADASGLLRPRVFACDSGFNLIVEELDGSPTVERVNKIKFDSSTGSYLSVTDNSDRSVTIKWNGETASFNLKVSETDSSPTVEDVNEILFDSEVFEETDNGGGSVTITTRGETDTTIYPGYSYNFLNGVLVSKTLSVPVTYCNVSNSNVGPTASWSQLPGIFTEGDGWEFSGRYGVHLTFMYLLTLGLTPGDGGNTNFGVYQRLKISTDGGSTWTDGPSSEVSQSEQQVAYVRDGQGEVKPFVCYSWAIPRIESAGVPVPYRVRAEWKRDDPGGTDPIITCEVNNHTRYAHHEIR